MSPLLGLPARRSPLADSFQGMRPTLERLQALQNARNWKGLAAMEAEAQRAAALLRGTKPGVSGGVYGMLGNAHNHLGDLDKAIEYHSKRLEIAEAIGDRAGVGKANGSLGIAYL